MNKRDYLAKAAELYGQARALLLKEDADAEDGEQRDRLIVAAQENKKRATQIDEIEAFAAGYDEKGTSLAPRQDKWNNVGEWIVNVRQAGTARSYEEVHPLLKGTIFNDPNEENDSSRQWLTRGRATKSSTKDLLESVGASGGFLVPVEFLATLLGLDFEANPIRQRATIIPMRRRQVNIPTLDQTGGAAGVSAQHGGIVATWTEEGTNKDETEPSFRQVNLVAHKLTCYTEASDELLDDEAVGLVAYLNGPMGFSGAIRWQEEFTFLQGTGAGQPLGIIPAGATITIPRQTTGTVTINDLFNMLENHYNENGCWHINRSFMSEILGLNGPAGNPSYVFIDNAREGLPMNLFGMPIFWTEKLPAIDEPGSICLCSWPYYLIGDRQAITLATSTEFRFRADLTAYRAVHRVDGQPWLSEPISLADGTDQISPFVILGGGGS